MAESFGVSGRGKFWAKSFTHLYPLVTGNRRHQVELNLDALRRIGIQPSPAERGVTFVPGPDAERRGIRFLWDAPTVLPAPLTIQPQPLPPGKLPAGH